MQLAVIAITDIIACLRRFVCRNRFLLLRRKCYHIRLLGCRLILHGCSICLLYGCLICRLYFRPGLCIFSPLSCLPALGRCAVPCDPGSITLSYHRALLVCTEYLNAHAAESVEYFRMRMPIAVSLTAADHRIRGAYCIHKCL